MIFSKRKAFQKITLLLGWLGLLIGPYVILRVVNSSHRHVFSRLFFKGSLNIIGIRLNTSGRPHCETVLYVANHGSYLDILILGALKSDAVFIAKREVESWPLFGFLARLADTIFVQRTAHKSKEQNDLMSRYMNKGNALILFPEGTSSDGSYVQHFKSTLFSSLENINQEAWVQPVTLAYTRDANGVALGQECRERFTWYDDQTLAPHLWRLLGLQGCEVDVVFHPPLHRNSFNNRKHMAQECHTIISETLRVAIDQTPPPLKMAAE